MIAHVVESRGPGEAFGMAAITEEIRQRWGAKRCRKVVPGSVSSTLRRWAAGGRQEGRAHHEALYRRLAGGGLAGRRLGGDTMIRASRVLSLAGDSITT